MAMKRFIVLFSTIALALILLSGGCDEKKTNSENTTTTMNENKKYTFTDYDASWKKVDSLDAKNLPKSALDLVNQIMAKATSDNNQPMQFKALMYQLKYSQVLEDNDFNAILAKINQLQARNQAPLSQLLSSLKAELIWNYYSNNRYQIHNRSQTQNFELNDITTWDLKKLMNEVFTNFNASLTNKEHNQSIALQAWDYILTNNTPETYLSAPTVYDFLAHRALSVLQNDELSITRPADKFAVNDSTYFGSDKQFLAINTQSEDSLSTQLHYIKTLQELVRFHQTNNYPVAKVRNQLKRYLFVYQNSTSEQKSTWYERALQSMQKEFANNPSIGEVNAALASLYIDLSANAAKNSPHYSLLKKAHELCTSTIKNHPNSVGSSQCSELLATIEEKSINGKVEAHYPSNNAILAKIDFKNVSRIFVQIYASNEDSKFKNYYQPKETIKKLKLISSQEVQLPSTDDFHEHTTEIALKPLDYGNYVVLYSTNPDKLDDYNEQHWLSNFQVTDLAFSTRPLGNGTSGIQVVNRQTGAPLDKTTVNVYESKYNYKLSKYEGKLLQKYTTNANGWAVLAHSNESYSKIIEVVNGKDVLSTNNSLYKYDNNHEQTYSDHIYTDRAIYRPGQTVYFKGIRLAHNNKKVEIAPNSSVRVGFKDVNYEEVSSLNLTTNEYGSYTGSFRIPTSGLTGEMSLETEYGSIYFSVEEYKRPTFKVEFEKSKEEYKLGTTVKVEGNAMAYAGNAVDNATVNYVVKRKSYLPFWRAYYYRISPYTSTETIISKGTATTDKEGKFSFSFDAEKDPTHRQGFNYTYTVEADVTDMNGETRSSIKYIHINESAVQLNVSVKDALDKSLENTLTIHASNADGEPVNSKGTIVISKLKSVDELTRSRMWEAPDKPLLSDSEFKAKFPYLSNSTTAQQFKEVESEIARLAFDTEKSTNVKLNTSNWKTGEYKIETTTKDKYGVEVKDVQFITLTDMRATEVPFPTIFNAYSLKSSYEPGETVKIPFASSLNNQLVLVEVFAAGKLISQQHVRLSNEQKVFEFKVEEQHRGGLNIQLSTIRYGKSYHQEFSILVPYSNKDLKVNFETFRNKLVPGEKEEWRLRITGPKKEKVAAELLLTMYDASLDVFRTQSMFFSPYAQSTYVDSRHYVGMGVSYGQSYHYRTYGSYNPIGVPQLNFYNFYLNNYYYIDGIPVVKEYSVTMSVRGARDDEAYMSEKKEMAPPLEESANAEIDADYTGGLASKNVESLTKTATQTGKEIPSLRTNFNETAFFLPQLKTDSKGDVLVTFTAPESLTSWKILGIAHTKDLQFANIENEAVTQKELMVQTNLPRFVRTGDEVVLTSKISNLTEKGISGSAQLQLFDAATMENVSARFELNQSAVNFSSEAKQSTVASWKIKVPADFMRSLVVRVTAKAANHTDGEEMTLPVLTDKVLVTETMPMTSNGVGTKAFTFEKLFNNSSTTLTHHSVTMEYSSNPAWYVIQALPYMMEYPYECSEQLFTRFYANAIASNIVRSTPKIKEVFEKWKSSNPDAFLSNLEKNQELKAVLLQETPWVLDAKNETERKKRIALLFDFNKMDNELANNLQKLVKAQVSNGGFPWFPGMPESRYITQYIVSGMGHLNELGITSINEYNDVQNMIKNAINYLDGQLVKDYNYWKKEMAKNKNIQYEPTNLQYLYARSFFNSIKMSKSVQEAFDFFRANTEKRWTEYSLNSQAMLALATHRLGNGTLANDIVKSIMERSITTEEMGMYWKENTSGYYWYQAPIETQSLIIEALTFITKDVKAINNAKIWLLRNKQTSDWKTTTATAHAAYALLLGGNSFAATPENAIIEINGKQIKPEDFGTQAEAGIGYFKTTWTGKEVSKELAKVKVTRKDDGFSWGAMYWQYFESMEKVTSATTNLKLKKQLFVVQQTNAGEVIVPLADGSKVNRGDKIRVRIELNTDRNLEYVHMKDYRAAGFEPLNVLSSYKWQDGLGYYESTKDVATHFFFDYLPKGTYVFEYDLRVFHSGNFTNGFAEIECMYAPEFKSHSNGVRVVVE